ncbi:MAG: hypothetical protein H0V64_02535 [Geodermatophilaceae bacterium]|nr:hypothetical protein [Geodermatophilaceae bacterium]MDQ3463437.1 hypothetical protein [Actinomycetota bacterium]
MTTDAADDRESDVDDDAALANSRETGGDPDAEGDDAGGTTGTGENEEFVGRVSGQDAGYEGETGAEARAAGQT